MKGDNHNPLFPKIEEYSEEMPPQDRVVFDCKIDLAGLPDETYGVEVLDWQKEPMEEVVGDEPLEEHQFRVDYTHGYLYFHPVHNKKTVTIQKYYSRGMLYFPASRVYSIDEHGRVDINTTLQDYIDSIKSWIFQGEYQAGKSYTANNSVYSDGSIYIAKQDVPANKIPKKNPAYWQPMSSGFLYRGEYNSSEVYYPREIVAYKKGYYACLQEVSGSTPGSGIAWQEIVSVDSIYEAWQGTDGNGGLKQEIAETLERVENTRDEIVQEWEGTENSEGLKQQLEDMLNGIVIEDNLTSTSTTSSLSAHQGKVLNDTKADKQTANGGFAGGAGAFAEHGGSVGMETKTGDGFAGGYQAKTVDANNNAIDAIQLGAGMNSTEKTLQVYDKQLLDAEGHIPDERMPQLADKQTEWIITTAGTGAAYTATLDPAPESLYIGMQITIIPHVSSSSSSATLNVNGTGAKYFRQRGRTTGTLYSPSVYSFLAAGKPTTLIYDGTYWVMTEYSRPNWNDIKDKPEAILSAENIIAGDNVTVTTNGNDVTISASGGGSDVNVVDNLTSTSTTSALSANQGKILDEKKANRQTEHGGFAGGEQSNAGDGGAIGLGADSSGGFAGGAVSSTSNGGAIGMEAKTGDGFAGGMYAKTMNAQGNGIDAIQLGTGTNTAPKTLQVYEYQLLDQNGKIPTERLLNAAGGYEVGDMLTTLRTDLDDSWLLCNGASISKTSYPELAQICPPELTRKWRYEYTSSFVSMNSEYAVANGYFVVLTNDKKIHYATNPTTNNWKTITLSISFTPNRIDYINGYWIVSGGGMNIAYTRDLNSTWTSVTAITTDHKNSSEIFTNIEYGDGYYAFGYNYIDTGYTYPAIAYSTTLNATSWNSTAIGSSVNASRGLAKLLYDPNRKRWLGLKNGVVVGRESITNGTFGTSSTPSANDVVNNVVFLNNKIVMLYNEKIRYMDSSNNIVVTPDATLTTNYSSITYGNGYWILPSGSNNEGNNYMLSSTDLEHWTRTPQQNIYVGEVLYTNGYFVGMQYAPSSGGTYGYIATNFNDKVLPAVYNDAGYTYIKAK